MFWCLGKKKSANHHCKIVLLDDTEFIQDFQDVSRGQQLLDIVFKHLNLMETAYFGLRFLDCEGQRHWLDPNKNVVRQLKGLETYTFYFGVKFYASDPCKLLEEITRYQFFLQVKQDIYQGRLPLTFDLTTELFAYAIQSELGDYDPRRHQPGYASEFRFAVNQTPDVESKAADIHKSFGGRVPAVAELSFLDRVKWLDMYGVDLHPVLGEDSIEYFLGLTPSGVLVLRNKSKVGNYFWPRISKVFYKRKYFMLRVRDKNNEENTYGFELPNKQACKHLWKCCIEHRAFFKLTQVREGPGQSNKFLGLENKFVYSGRPTKNIQMGGLIQARSRTPPSFVRVPSRRYQKRLGQPDGADAGTQAKEEDAAREEIRVPETGNVVPPPIAVSPLQRSTSVPSVTPYASPYKAPPWDDPRLRNRGMYLSGANTSPRSVRSAGALPSSTSRRHHHRSGSVDSTNSYEYRKRKHHHHSSRRQSDNESEISKSSRCSKNSRSSRHSRRRGSQSGDGSDSESQQRQRRHSRRKKHGSSYELVNSEAQWRDVQRLNDGQSQVRTHNAVVRDLSKRKSGYTNSGLETESETNYSQRRRHRRHRSRSPDSKNALPNEVKRCIQYNLVDPSTLTEEERRDIKYTKVQADSRFFKVRYSPSSSRSNLHTSQISIRDPSSARHSSDYHHQFREEEAEEEGDVAGDLGQDSYPPNSNKQPPLTYLRQQQHMQTRREEEATPMIGHDAHQHRTLLPKVTLAQTHNNNNGFRISENSTFLNANEVRNQNFSNSVMGWNQRTSRCATDGNSQFTKEERVMNGHVPNKVQDNRSYNQDRIAGKVRMINGHFYPAPTKPQSSLPPRVTFQNENGSPQQLPKAANASRSWVQPPPPPPPRANGEAQKPAFESSQGHEMSTEL